MGFLDFIKGELLEIIEWTDDSRDTLAYRFPDDDKAIKNGAQLIVRESQVVQFVYLGEFGDTFDPGKHRLVTDNIPILTRLASWKYRMESPFKADVYFVNTRLFTGNKWGTKNPIMLRDPEFGPLRLRAFGTYAFKAGDPATLIREIVGTDGHFQTEDLSDQLRNLIVSRFTDVLAESKLAALDLAANYDELGEFVRAKIEEEFNGYGIDVTSLLVENISLPPAVEEMLDKRTSMGIVGDLGAYTQFQAAQAMEKAAETPGSGAGQGMGMGMGFAMANQMAQGFGGRAAGPAGPGGGPPPPPVAMQWYLAENGQTVGPMDAGQLSDAIGPGRVSGTTQVWCTGMAAWQAAGRVPQLATSFGPPPPPPPPAP